MPRFIVTNIILVVLAAMGFSPMLAQDNDKILNRQYADLKPIHFGFSFGVNFQDLHIVNNGFITPDGEQWWADIPNHSPGFCVNVMADWRLGTHFNLRISPGMYFGNKVVKFRNSLGDPDAPERSHYIQQQNVKTTYIVAPLDLKFSARRYHNLRPYFTGGVMPIFNVGKDRSEQYRIKSFDAMLTVGLGCDFYLPYFKLCPEVKFCFGLRNILEKSRPDLQDNPEMLRFTESADKITNNMVVVTFYFE
ncbi:MAG: PorT family protein [Muribaculaceae bacterium]|nr:PorT family protein [Muribaculaceae bacterium]